jgi:hypothetical protein
MKTYRRILEIMNKKQVAFISDKVGKDWTTKVGSGAGKDWKIKKTDIDNKGNVSIHFKTPDGPSVMKAGAGARKHWKIKKSWIENNGDVFITFIT